MTKDPEMRQGFVLTRRPFLLGAAALAVLPLLPRPARATPADARRAMAKIIGDRTLHEGRIALDLPFIAEDGSSVPMTLEVDSPMTEDDHVRSVHVFAERNPLPGVLDAHFTPRSGLARVSTRIRLAESQRVHALAVMSDGTVYGVSHDITVTIGGCGV